MDSKHWTPFKLCSFQAFHLFYADDVILFGAATLDNLGNVITTIGRFGQLSGLNISVHNLVL